MKLLVPALAAMLALFAFAPAHAQDSGEDLIEATSPHPVGETVDKLAAAVENAGAKIAARIDHQANAKSVGQDIPAATVLIFGNPKVGTPFIAADPMAGLDLPVRVLVFDDDGQTKLAATAPETLAERYGLAEMDEAAVKTMRGAIEKLMAAAAAK